MILKEPNSQSFILNRICQEPFKTLGSVRSLDLAVLLQVALHRQGGFGSAGFTPSRSEPRMRVGSRSSSRN